MRGRRVKGAQAEACATKRKMAAGGCRFREFSLLIRVRLLRV